MIFKTQKHVVWFGWDDFWYWYSAQGNAAKFPDDIGKIFLLPIYWITKPCQAFSDEIYHKWHGQQAGGSPVEASSTEWVCWCLHCGNEDQGDI